MCKEKNCPNLNCVNVRLLSLRDLIKLGRFIEQFERTSNANNQIKCYGAYPMLKNTMNKGMLIIT